MRTSRRLLQLLLSWFDTTPSEAREAPSVQHVSTIDGGTGERRDYWFIEP
ncbi:MAG: hypothetical protein AAFO29_18775 [Actinomycetota bacterium]